MNKYILKGNELHEVDGEGRGHVIAVVDPASALRILAALNSIDSMITALSTASDLLSSPVATMSELMAHADVCRNALNEYSAATIAEDAE